MHYLMGTIVFLMMSGIPSAKEIAYVRDDVMDNYREFVAGRELLTINDFSGEHIRRDVVDMVIAQQALLLGGFQINIEFVPGRLNYRNKQLLKSGKLLLSFDSYWLSDAKPLEEFVYISEPVIRRGEYHAGIFASPNHPSIFTVSHLEDLRQFSGVSTPKWATDWQTMQSLELANLFHEDSWVAQANMVYRMLADFMLMPFYSDLEEVHRLGDISLKPIPDVAILLNDSRHFVVSKSHPQGHEAFEALHTGMEKLRSNKAIVKAYTQAGFFIDTDKFKVINQ